MTRIRPGLTVGATDADVSWSHRWRGRWIWDRRPDEIVVFPFPATESRSHFTYLRQTFHVTSIPGSVPARATCDSRYVLFVNGTLLGRGPIRGEPEFLSWDEYDLAPALREGRNVLVALCRYYGTPGPWWRPAPPFGPLGRGSFCFETAADSQVDVTSDGCWRAVEAPWKPITRGAKHNFPPEIVDGRLVPDGLHDANAGDADWPAATVLTARGHGTVVDRPPASPYTSPLRRPIPQLSSVALEPRLIAEERSVRAQLLDDPTDTWWKVVAVSDGERRLSVWDLGCISVGHLRLRLSGGDGSTAGDMIDVVAGEDLRSDGWPEVRAREWAARYILGSADSQEIVFFDPLGARYLAAHYPPGIEVSVSFEEAVYPNLEHAEFDCDDERYSERWRVGSRTNQLCSTDAFLADAAREQRAWVADAYVQTLVTFVTNPDWRLARHHLALTARSQQPGGLLTAAAACDLSQAGVTMPEYSLHWIRSLAAYWRYAADEAFVRGLLPVADAIIERYERQRGPSGLLEDFPGWVFIDWAQIDRDVVTGVHDALYAAALHDYAGLPGAAEVGDLIERTTDAFDALWDEERGVYVDAIGDGGPSRRVSQHTNGVALLAGLVPEHRTAELIERITEPGGSTLGGRLVLTPTSADMREPDLIEVYQFEAPSGFDPEQDVVMVGPWFCRFLHEAFFRHGRRDLILASLLRWKIQPGHGTFQEFWDAAPGMSNRCQAWSASPTYDLTAYILGVRPVEPGYRRTVVDPYLGSLSHVSGRIPTPLGWLELAIADSEVTLDVPSGMTVDVSGHEVAGGRHIVPLVEGG